MRFTKKYLLPAGVLSLALAVTACAPSGNDDGAADESGGQEPVAVSLITSETGPLAAYGEQFIGGFEAGWDYVTDGTGEIDGREVNITYSDDGGDPDKAVSIIKDEIGKGTKIFTGTVVSGIALALAEQADLNDVLYIAGASATDALTGINDNTFRSGRQTAQDVATAGTFLGDPSGKEIVVFAQDNAFGQSNVAGVENVLGAKGAKVSSILVPEDATDFTPFAQQLLQTGADLAFVAWAGANTSSMWGALSQQGVFDGIQVVTGLADVATYNAYGPVSDKISFLNHYFAGATDNTENLAMIDYLEANDKVADIFSPDGFNAAVMIAEAIRSSGDDVPTMIDALEGFEFKGPKGDMTVRASDHALLQDMFQVRLVKDGDNWIPELIDVAPASEVAPAEAAE